MRGYPELTKPRITAPILICIASGYFFRARAKGLRLVLA
jgi:hypothetical protein